MRTLTSILAAGLLACSMSAIANENNNPQNNTGNNTGVENNAVTQAPKTGQFSNECAWGLANDKHVETNCSVNMTGEDGKTYCFSNDKAMAAFMKNPSKNMDKADKNFGRS